MPLLVRRFAAALILAVTAQALAACRGAAPSPAAAPIAPLRIVLGLAGDAATSRAVTWRTTSAVATPLAQFGPAEPECRGTAGSPRDVTATPRVVRLDNGRTVTHYRADFTGLEPATRYAYRVGDGTSFSAWHCFATASAEGAPFRFIYLGDAQNGFDRKWPRVVRAAFAAAPDARFVVHAGDLLSEGYDDELWGAWLEGIGGRATEIPGVPVPGNHDLHRSPVVDASGTVFAASALWNAHFALPANGPPGLPGLAGQNYFVDYQGVRIIGVDVNAFANEDFEPSARARVKAAQVAWLRQVLGTGPQRWTIVVQHQPIFSVVKHRNYAEMRAVLGAIYDAYRVDLVLQGHDHVYARTHKVSGGQLAAPGSPGTIYVIAVSGPKMYGITNRRAPMMAVMREDTQSYQVVSVAGNRLSYESRAVTGVLVDAFELVKAGGSTSTYVDLAPGAAGADRSGSPQPSGAARAR